MPPYQQTLSKLCENCLTLQAYPDGRSLHHLPCCTMLWPLPTISNIVKLGKTSQNFADSSASKLRNLEYLYTPLGHILCDTGGYNLIKAALFYPQPSFYRIGATEHYTDLDSRSKSFAQNHQV